MQQIEALARKIDQVTVAQTKSTEMSDKNFQTLTERLSALEKSTIKRREEIRNLSQAVGKMITDDDTTGIPSDDEIQVTCESSAAAPSRPSVSRRESQEPRRLPTELEHRPAQDHSAPLYAPKDLIKILKPLRGRDDIGVEDFIKTVKKIRSKCNDQEILLDLILSTKIEDQAERNIRHLAINTYDELFSALRTHVAPPVTISSCRQKLQSMRQGITESVQSYNTRFRAQMNELYYAIQNTHTNPTQRKVALKIEEEMVVPLYVQHLRSEIGKMVFSRDPKTFMEAQTLAMETEVWLKETSFDRSRSKPYIAENKQHPIATNNVPPRQSITRQNQNLQASKSLPKCDNCQKLGHTTDKCFMKRNFYSTSQGKLPPRANAIEVSNQEAKKTTEQESPQCQDDSDTYGHDLEECANTDSYSWTRALE